MTDRKKDPKMVAAGHQASETKGFEAERRAAWLANDTNKGWKPGTTQSMHERPEFTCSVCHTRRRSEQLSDDYEVPTCRDCAS
jgi:hypothetical protein